MGWNTTREGEAGCEKLLAGGWSNSVSYGRFDVVNDGFSQHKSLPNKKNFFKRVQDFIRDIQRGQHIIVTIPEKRVLVSQQLKQIYKCLKYQLLKCEAFV